MSDNSWIRQGFLAWRIVNAVMDPPVDRVEVLWAVGQEAMVQLSCGAREKVYKEELYPSEPAAMRDVVLRLQSDREIMMQRLAAEETAWIVDRGVPLEARVVDKRSDGCHLIAENGLQWRTHEHIHPSRDIARRTAMHEAHDAVERHMEIMERLIQDDF